MLLNLTNIIRGRRFVAVAATVFLVASILSGCADDVGAAEEREPARVSEQDVLGYYQSILTFPRSGPSYPSALNDYLMEQSRILGVEAQKDGQGNVVMHAPATVGMERLRPTVLLAYTGADIVNERSESFDPYTDGVRLVPSDEDARAEGTSMGADGALGAATMLAVLEHAQAHGDITACFLTGDGTGGEAGTPILPEHAAVIRIGGSDTGKIMAGSPRATLLDASATTGAVAPGGGRAYVIAASGFPAGPARAGNSGDYMSPVSVIAKILSDAKGSGCVYGLYEFTGGTDACLLPVEAQATVILGDYEAREFRRVFNSVREGATDAVEGATVSMIETARPASVTDKDAVSKALTYIFGLMALGASESEENTAAVNIGRISLTPESFNCGVAVAGRDVWSVRQIVNAQSAFERISGIPVEVAGEIPGFGGDAAGGQDADDAAARLAGAYGEVTGDDVTEYISDGLGSLGRYAENRTARGIGISVYDAGTPNERFARDEAAIPANVILKYLTNN
jgi:dipeptidase D